MSFSILPEEIKVKIFNMLSLWDRYNASIVWEEMAYETWRKIPSHEDLINRLTDQNDATVRKEIVHGFLGFIDLWMKSFFTTVKFPQL